MEVFELKMNVLLKVYATTRGWGGSFSVLLCQVRSNLSSCKPFMSNNIQDDVQWAYIYRIIDNNI